MIRIFICEDDTAQANRIKKIIQDILLMNDFDACFYCQASDPEELLCQLPGSNYVGLYFLDVDLHSQMNGIQLAEKIRSHDPRGYIVFITAYGNAAPLTFRYKVEAMDFIVKNGSYHLEDRIYSCIVNALDNHKRFLTNSNQLLKLKVENTVITIDQNDILFITPGRVAHSILIHTFHGTKQTPGSLAEISQYLNHWFCYCNRSEIVNLKNAVSYKSNLLTLKNDIRCKVSHRRAREVKEAMLAVQNM